MTRHESIILTALAHYRAVQEWTLNSSRSSATDKMNAASRLNEIDAAMAEITDPHPEGQALENCYCCADPEHCCPLHGTHVMPHRGCVLR